ncbi:MAG: glycosyltransferase family 2 protein [bacterium]|nr:glycosyltransferase family 2 protein [bacterium]
MKTHDDDVWFVILTYFPDKKKLTPLLHALDGKKIVLVDNTPGNEGMLVRADVRGLHLIQMKNNTGYARGMNTGMAYVFEHGGTWAVLCNDDIEISKIKSGELEEALGHTPAGVAGPFPGSLDAKRWTSVYPVKPTAGFSYISGSCMAVHRSVYERLGGFYERYFMYYEDVDFCVRVRRMGFSLTTLSITPKHTDGSSFQGSHGRRQYYLARNHLLFVERLAPFRVKVYEYLRLPLTWIEHVWKGEFWACVGVVDYLVRRFDRKWAR